MRFVLAVNIMYNVYDKKYQTDLSFGYWFANYLNRLVKPKNFLEYLEKKLLTIVWLFPSSCAIYFNNVLDT